MAKADPGENFAKFFQRHGKRNVLRDFVLDEMEPDQIVEVIRFLLRHDPRHIHELCSYVNTHHTQAQELTPEDVRRACDLIKVKKVQEA